MMMMIKGGWRKKRRGSTEGEGIKRGSFEKEKGSKKEEGVQRRRRRLRKDARFGKRKWCQRQCIHTVSSSPSSFFIKKMQLKGEMWQYKCSVPISPLRSVSSSRPNFTNSLLVGLNPLSLNASPSSSIDIAPLRERCGEIGQRYRC